MLQVFKKSAMVAVLGAAGLLSMTSTDARASERIATFLYDANGMLYQERVEEYRKTDVAGGEAPSNEYSYTEYSRDIFGNVIQTVVGGQDVVGRHSYTAYDATGRHNISNTNALGHSDQWEYEPRRGQPIKHTDPNGLVTTWEYDGFGNKIKETAPDGTYTTWEYAYCNGFTTSALDCSYKVWAYRVSEQSFNNWGGPLGPLKKAYYDTHGRVVVQITQTISAKGAVRVDTEYDSMGRVKRQSLPYFESETDPEDRKWMVPEYDVLGRTVRETAPDGTITSTRYEGLTTHVTNNSNQTTSTVKNADGQIVWVTQPFASNEPAEFAAYLAGTLTNTTGYQYDEDGNLTRTTDAAGNVTQIDYDDLGRKIRLIDPDTGTWVYRYNSLGEMTFQRNTSDAETKTWFEYDLLGREVKRKMGSYGWEARWTYDTAANGLGALARKEVDYSPTVTNAAWTEYTYDTMGRPTEVRNGIGAETQVTTASYIQATGQLQSVTQSSGFRVLYGYELGYLVEVFDRTIGAPTYGDQLWRMEETDAHNRVIQDQMGNGVRIRRTFDELTQLPKSILSWSEGSTFNDVASFFYSWDTIGNLQARASAYVEGGTTHTVNETFTYDHLNRLQAWYVDQTGDGVAEQGAGTHYNLIGNITYKDGVGHYHYDQTGSAGPHAVTRITGGSWNADDGVVRYSFDHDSRGNQTIGRGRTIHWHSFDKVYSISRNGQSRYHAYDADGALTYRYTQDDATSAILDHTYYFEGAGGRTELKVDPATGERRWKDFIYAGNRLVAQRFLTEANGATPEEVKLVYFSQDHLGSVSVLTDETGQVIERQAYDPWGKRMFADGTPDPGDTLRSITEQGFTGHEHWDELGLINMGGRLYDPHIARFLSADPFVQDPGDGQMLNRYSYVRNNPLNATDPTGFFLNKAFKGLFRAIGNIPIIGDAMRFVATNQYLSSMVSIGVGILTGGSGAVTWALIAQNAAWAAGTQVAMVGMAGGGLGDALKAGAIAGATVAAFGGIHQLKAGKFGTGFLQDFANTAGGSAALHGAVGGTASVASGGKFHSGFLAGGFANLAGSFGVDRLGFNEVPGSQGEFFGRTAYQAVAGGVGSIMGGSKFGNGAITGAFGYLFNDVLTVGGSYTLNLFGFASVSLDGGTYLELPNYWDPENSGRWDLGLRGSFSGGLDIGSIKAGTVGKGALFSESAKLSYDFGTIDQVTATPSVETKVMAPIRGGLSAGVSLNSSDSRLFSGAKITGGAVHLGIGAGISQTHSQFSGYISTRDTIDRAMQYADDHNW